MSTFSSLLGTTFSRAGKAALPVLALSLGLAGTANAVPVKYILTTEFTGDYYVSAGATAVTVNQVPATITMIADTDNIHALNADTSEIMGSSITLKIGSDVIALDPQDFKLFSAICPACGDFGANRQRYAIVSSQFTTTQGPFYLATVQQPEILALDKEGLITTEPGSGRYSFGSQQLDINGTGAQTTVGLTFGFFANVDTIEVKFLPNTKSFSFFAPVATKGAKEPELKLGAGFSLSTNTNGINPATEVVKLSVGSYSVTVPAGGFKKGKLSVWTYTTAKVAGVQRKIVLTQAGANAWVLAASLYDTKAGLAGVVKGAAADMTLTIGDDTGTKNIIVR